MEYNLSELDRQEMQFLRARGYEEDVPYIQQVHSEQVVPQEVVQPADQVAHEVVELKSDVQKSERAVRISRSFHDLNWMLMSDPRHLHPLY